MGFTASESSEAGSVPLKRALANLERLDVYVAVLIICLQADGSGKVGGHRQKLNNYKISSDPPIALVPKFWHIGGHVEPWCSGKVTVFLPSIDRNEELSSGTFQCRTTVEVFILSSRRRLYCRVVSVVYRTNYNCHGYSP